MRTLVLALSTAALVALACGRREVRLPPQAPIVVVLVDTLRADGLGLYGYPRDVSGALDARAARAAVFERAFAPAPWTLPSVGSLLTGRYPANHGAGRGRIALEGGGTAGAFLGLRDSSPRMASLLADAGYDTAAFVTNTFLRPKFGVAEGFARYDFGRSRARDERRADVMVDLALAWIDERERGEPWFLFLHLLDPHLPYDPPPASAGRFTADYGGTLAAPFGTETELVQRVNAGEVALDTADRAFLRGVYDEEVTFVAEQLARLLDGLGARGVLERGLVFLTADHGEEFFDHERFEHGHTLYQELLHVPLVVWGHGVQPGRRGEPVSLVDVLPTMLEAAGLAHPVELDGVSLWPLLTGGDAPPARALVAENSLYGDQRRALVEWPYKLIVNLEREAVELYDLAHDPAEQSDLAAARPELAARLAAALAERVPAAGAGDPVDLDEETKRELQALGYLR